MLQGEFLEVNTSGAYWCLFGLRACQSCHAGRGLQSNWSPVWRPGAVRRVCRVAGPGASRPGLDAAPVTCSRTKKGTGHLLQANPLILRAGDFNSRRLAPKRRQALTGARSSAVFGISPAEACGNRIHLRAAETVVVEHGPLLDVQSTVALCARRGTRRRRGSAGSSGG